MVTAAKHDLEHRLFNSRAHGNIHTAQIQYQKKTRRLKSRSQRQKKKVILDLSQSPSNPQEANPFPFPTHRFDRMKTQRDLPSL